MSFGATGRRGKKKIGETSFFFVCFGLWFFLWGQESDSFICNQPFLCMCSVARLTRSHASVQAAHVAEAYRAYDTLLDFSIPGDLDPSEFQRRCEERARHRRFEVAPAEGWLSARAHELSDDPMLTRSTWHDIVPRELLRQYDPSTRDHSGTDVICRAVAAQVRMRLEEYGLFERLYTSGHGLHEHFAVRKHMHVHVVNIVHSSYCTMPRAETSDVKTLFPSVFMWRRLSYLGCRENHAHTSVKISFKPPFKASKLFFTTGRVLETGASNEDVSHVIFFDAALEYFRRAGLHGLMATSRTSQNIVAKSRLPDGQGLLLDLLPLRLGSGRVTYQPDSFAGAVVAHHSMSKVMLLAFSAGSIVCVGPKDLPSMRHALDTIYDTLQQYVDTPANRLLLEQYNREHICLAVSEDEDGAAAAAAAHDKRRQRRSKKKKKNASQNCRQRAAETKTPTSRKRKRQDEISELRRTGTKIAF